MILTKCSNCKNNRVEGKTLCEQCRVKERVRTARYYEENKAAINARAKAYAKKNSVAIAARYKAWREKNSVAIAAQGKAYREKNKAALAATGRAGNLRKYGLTVADYDAMMKSQGGVCAACGDRPEKTKLCVDHDHTTGQVRGLLCVGCNIAIGHSRDSAARLRGLAEYMDRHSQLHLITSGSGSKHAGVVRDDFDN